MSWLKKYKDFCLSTLLILTFVDFAFQDFISRYLPNQSQSPNCFSNFLDLYLYLKKNSAQ